MGPGMLGKHFNFVPNKTLNIKQAFIVFPKEKELWTVSMAPWKHSFKI